jgi:hypothetical protein
MIPSDRLQNRSYFLEFVFNDEDWRDVSAELKRQFPNSVYFQGEEKDKYHKAEFDFRNHRSPLDPRIEKNVPDPDSILLADDLVSSFALPHPKKCKSILIRDPWPEDFASGSKLDLIGGWEGPRSPRSALESRINGRLVVLACYPTKYCPASECIYNGSVLFVEHAGTLPADAYKGVRAFHARFEDEFVARWNEFDPETKEFVHAVRRIFLNQGTRSVAIYNPLTNEILDPKYEAPIIFGWRALLDAMAPDPIYVMAPFWTFRIGATCHPRRDGVAGLIGPRPDHPRLKRLLAGELIQSAKRPTGTKSPKQNKKRHARKNAKGKKKPHMQ